ncbi:hypothetical protein JCM10212_004771 [Sporobolomyces blumeae]
MDGSSQPIYTQEQPMGESNAPSTAAATQPLAAEAIPVASTTAASSEATQPPVSAMPAHPDTQTTASTSDSFPGSAFAPFPEQSPLALPLVGFASVPSRAAVLPNAKPYIQPPPYDAQPPQLGAGLSTNPPVRRIIDDAETAKMRAEEVRSPGVVREEEVAKLSVAELKKMGLGRVPSGFCYSARMTLHKPLPKSTANGDDPHPEQPSRIIGVFQKLDSAGLTARMQRIAVREAVRDEVMLVHSEGHWDRVRATGFQTVEYLETCTEFFDRLSLYVNPDSSFAARLSCGGVIEMCRAVAEGQIRNGFAIVRPPGHHAEPEEAMGFCFFNNVAIAARWLQTVYGAGGQKDVNGKEIKMQKVLILDWDVHHGNGTQKAFEDDPSVLYISLHRHADGFYPGGTYGALESVGSGAGQGFSVNIPFPDTGMGDADYIYAFQQIVMPIAYEFVPDIVLVSAGYDAAAGDELGKMKVSPAGYAHMTHLLSALSGGKLVLALEGGYNVDSVVKSSHACVEILVGDEPPYLPSLGAASLSATNTVHNVMRMQSTYWKSMGAAVATSEELKKAGKTISLTEMLRAHRVYELYNEYSLFSVELADPVLEETFSNQVLMSEDVYDAETLLVFMHDLGSIKASYLASTLDVDLEKTQLLDTSREVLDWALHDNDFGVVDVNFLAHLPTIKGQPPDATRNRELEKKLALFVWDTIVSLSSAANVILFGTGAGCSAIVNIVQNRGPLVPQRVRACISVLGHEPPPELDASCGVRPWYKLNSFVLLPSTHPLHEDSRKAGKQQKKFGNIFRSTAEDEARPTHLLRASMGKIKEFVATKLPAPVRKLAPVVDESAGTTTTTTTTTEDGDVPMANGESAAALVEAGPAPVVSS